MQASCLDLTVRRSFDFHSDQRLGTTRYRFKKKRYKEGFRVYRLGPGHPRTSPDIPKNNQFYSKITTFWWFFWPETINFVIFWSVLAFLGPLWSIFGLFLGSIFINFYIKNLKFFENFEIFWENSRDLRSVKTDNNS